MLSKRKSMFEILKNYFYISNINYNINMNNNKKDITSLIDTFTGDYNVISNFNNDMNVVFYNNKNLFTLLNNIFFSIFFCTMLMNFLNQKFNDKIFR